MSGTPLQAIVGLGNPGPEHLLTRHNAGFWLADALAAKYGATFRSHAKYHGEVCRVVIAGQDLTLLKPQTYMNRSGLAVRALCDYLKVPADRVLIAYDELDLPLGIARFKFGGGAGGHNGIRSLDAHVGPDYWRVRIGVGHPGQKELVKHYVLHDFDAEEKPEVEKIITAIADNFPLLYERGHEHYMTKVALALNPPPPKPPREETAKE